MPLLFLTRAGWGGDYFQCPVVVVTKMAKEDMRATLESDLRMLVGTSAQAQLLLPASCACPPHRKLAHADCNSTSPWPVNP